MTMRAYRPDIDGLRAVAVTSVLLFHCDIVSGGFVGVDVFFVISGFLITGLISSEIDQGNFSLAQFYVRRIRRIVPALFVTLSATWIVAACLMLPNAFLQTSWAMIASAASVSNIYFWQSDNYFAPDSHFQPFLHTWSLAVEEQFYLFVPLLLMLAARFIQLRLRWIILFGSLCGISFIASVLATDTVATANFYLLPTRAWELGIGALVAVLPRSQTRRSGSEIVSLLAVCAILRPVFGYDSDTPFPGFNALSPCVGSALLILPIQQRTYVNRLLALRPFVAIGLISYSLYLVHWPLIVFLRYESVGVLGIAQKIIIIAGSVVLAWLMWRYVEQPFRRSDSTWTRYRVIGGGLVACTIAGLIGSVGVMGRGLPQRFPNFKEQTITSQTAWNPHQCFLLDPDYHHWSATNCTLFNDGQRRVLLWGDSFAAHYVPGLLAVASQLPVTLLQYTAAGCLPVLDSQLYGLRRCRAFSDHVVDVIKEQHIDTVVMAGRWSSVVATGGLIDLAATITTLDRLGVRIVLIGQSPEFATDVQTIGYMKGSSRAVNRWNVTFPLSINDQLRLIAGHHDFIDPIQAMCSQASCPYEDSGKFLYADNGHYSVTGSYHAVEAMQLANRLTTP